MYSYSYWTVYKVGSSEITSSPRLPQLLEYESTAKMVFYMSLNSPICHGTVGADFGGSPQIFTQLQAKMSSG